jgi:hypothetical protein
VLLSAKSLNQHYHDEQILQETQLPPWMELDTIYYIKVKGREQLDKAKGHIKMCECTEIYEKDMVN